MQKKKGSVLKDLTGQRFGQWTVVGVSDEVDKRQRALWDVVCVCGVRDRRGGQSLWKSKHKSKHKNTAGKGMCPHQMRPNIAGKQFGQLTVLKWKKKCKASVHDKFLCRCQCGAELTVTRGTLHSKQAVPTCKKCRKCQRYAATDKKYNAPEWSNNGQIPRWYWAGLLYRTQRKKIAFDLTPDQLWQAWKRQNGICAITGWAIKLSSRHRAYDEHTASLDRIDSTKGYTEDNIQWTHKYVNLSKGDLPQQEFINLCKLVTDYHNDPKRPVHDVMGFS